MILFQLVTFGEPFRHLKCRNLIHNNKELCLVFKDVNHPDCTNPESTVRFYMISTHFKSDDPTHPSFPIGQLKEVYL